MRIAHIGNLANNAYIFCGFLRRRGIDVHLFLFEKEWDMPRQYDGSDWQKTDWIHPIDQWPAAPTGVLGKGMAYLSRLGTARHLAQFDVVHSWTAALADLPLAHTLLDRAQVSYVAIATGSDLREGTRRRDWRGHLLRRHFSRARTTGCGPDRITVQQIKALGLRYNHFMHFPVDTQRYRPLGQKRLYPEFDLLFFHPSRLDWGIEDRGQLRASMKNTDLFFRALARYNAQGGNAGALVLERGADVKWAKALVEELGLGSRVRWMADLDQEQLPQYYSRCDVVVDQFHIGGFGTVALEAMACGAPLMIYIDENYHHMSYPEAPPVYNCAGEEEVLKAIVAAGDPAANKRLGERARQFIMTYHHWETVVDDWIGEYQRLAAGAGQEAAGSYCFRPSGARP